jgi:glycosyltransferase involved in cell wall biosynthesis
MDKILNDINMPLVSVIMPAYNSANYIYEAIFSILNQSFSDFEFIIIDDGSTDNTLLEISKFTDNRIVLLKNNTNKGIVYSLNYAISIAKGILIARMDADDISNFDRLKKQVLEFQKNPNLILCGSWYKIIFNNIIIRKIKLPYQNDIIKMELHFRNVICHPSCMFKKKLWLNLNGYSEKDINCEDFGLWVKGLDEGDYYNIPEFLLEYRVHNTNISLTKSTLTKNALFEITKNSLLNKYNLLIISNDINKTFDSYIKFIKNKNILHKNEFILFQKYFFKFILTHFGIKKTFKFIYKFNPRVTSLELLFSVTNKVYNFIFNLKIKILKIYI